MKQHISNQLQKQATILAPIGAAGGFISDVLQPLAPFCQYLFMASLGGSLILITLLLRLRARRGQLTPILVLSASLLLVSGMMLALQTKESEAKGVLASNIHGIEALQASLGLIQKDVAEIKETTKKTAEGVARLEAESDQTAKATESIARSTDKIVASLENIQQGFVNLTKSGGIIENASKPEEHYHNARLFEQRGDYLNARRSYNSYFAFKLNFLDPHLRYQSFLTLQEGRAGAREIYSTLYENDKRPLIEYARALLFDAPQRTEMLKAFVAANPDFAPAYYELSREFSAARKGAQSLTDKRAEREAIDMLQKLNAEGKFLKYFVDKELATNWLQDIETRGKALAAVKATLDNPITLLAMRSNSDWTVTLQTMEIPREIFYRLEGEDSFRSTGIQDVKNWSTGLNMPVLHISLKPNTQKTNLYVKYTDVGGEMRGPFTLEFDPDKALFDGQKKIVAMTKNSWVSFRDYDGRLLLYYTHLMSYRCAVKEIAYGIDSDSTPSQFEVPPCDPKQPNTQPAKGGYIEIPRSSKNVMVQLTYLDGTKSEAVRFDR